ncbi:MAG: hypothetical protein P8X63_09635 [Desulfuromonadaceae bacterium]
MSMELFSRQANVSRALAQETNLLNMPVVETSRVNFSRRAGDLSKINAVAVMAIPRMTNLSG